MTKATATQTKSLNACYCGCGFAVKGSYKQGHDAKHVSSLLCQIVIGQLDSAIAYEALPSAALRNKLRNAIDNAAKKEAKAIAKREAKREAKANKAPKGKQQCDRCGAWVKEGMLVHDDLTEEAVCSECVSNAISPTEVKVGRWWYPIVSVEVDGIVYRAKDDSDRMAKVDAQTR